MNKFLEWGFWFCAGIFVSHVYPDWAAKAMVYITMAVNYVMVLLADVQGVG